VTVPTVVWWRQDSEGRLLELLVVGPGPGPVLGQAWPGTIAQPGSVPGAWAVVNLPALGALPVGLVGQLGAAAGGDGVGGEGAEGDRVSAGHGERLSVAVVGRCGEVVADRHGTLLDQLYDGCAQTALALVGQRLTEPVVAADPFSAGVLLARRAGSGGGVTGLVELAPAVVSSGAGLQPEPLVVGVPLVLDRIEQVASGSVSVSLGTAEPATLPSVTVLLPRVLGASPELSLELAVPDLRLPAQLLDRWRPTAAEDPRLRLAL
jgi:hypothetical protein